MKPKGNKVTDIEKLTGCILNSLTPDLLKGEYLQRNKTNPLFGYCYVATEALHFLIRSLKLPEQYLGYRPWKSSSGNGPHWWLQDESKNRLDLTADQYTAQVGAPPYDSGCPAPFESDTPCPQTSVVIGRVNFLLGLGEIQTENDLKWYLRLLHKCGSTKYGYFGEVVYKDVMEKEHGVSLESVHSQGYDFLTDGKYKDDVKSRLCLDKTAPAVFKIESRSNRAEGRRYPHVVFYDDMVAVFDTEQDKPQALGQRSWRAVLELFRNWQHDKRGSRHIKRTGQALLKTRKREIRDWIWNTWKKRACAVARDSKTAMEQMNRSGWGPEAFYQPLFDQVTGNNKLREFAGCFLAPGDPLGAYLRDRFSIFAQDEDGIPGVHTQIETAFRGGSLAVLSRTLQVELSKIAGGECIYEESRFRNVKLSSEAQRLLANRNGSQREVTCLNLELLKSAYPGYLVENTCEVVILVYLHEGKDYEVCAYPLKGRFHEIAWLRRPVTNPDRRMSFAPGLLAERFIFEGIEHFKDEFMSRFGDDFRA